MIYIYITTKTINICKEFERVSTLTFLFKIERGVRFYGYLDDTEKVSFAELNVSSEEVSSLTFTFKTKEDSGLLFYSSNKVNVTFF